MPLPPGNRREVALAVVGVVLAITGDVLILGRPASGRDFDRATGLVPIEHAADRFPSLWNGSRLPASRVRLGSATGIVGIVLLSRCGLGRAARTVAAGPLRHVATGSVVVFALAGALTHHAFGAGVLARGQALHAHGPGRPVGSDAGLLSASAAAALGSLAVLSLSLTVDAGRSGRSRRRQALATPLPWVAATLATFGRLPAPVGGYLRPASISIGLAVHLALDAVAGRAAPAAG